MSPRERPLLAYSVEKLQVLALELNYFPHAIKYYAYLIVNYPLLDLIRPNLGQHLPLIFYQIVFTQPGPFPVSINKNLSVF